MGRQYIVSEIVHMVIVQEDGKLRMESHKPWAHLARADGIEYHGMRLQPVDMSHISNHCSG